MGRRLLFAISSAGMLSATLACSGADPGNLLGDSGLVPGEDSGIPTADASATTDVDQPPDATVADVTTEDVQVDVTPDIHTGPADTKIDCGPSVQCSAQKEICCHHTGTTNTPYECVTSPSSCAGQNDVPIACSAPANCASQGNPTYSCCATGGVYGTGQCYYYDVAVSVACKPDCTTGLDDYEIGCSVQKQNCSDSLQTCVISKCTLPGYTMCY